MAHKKKNYNNDDNSRKAYKYRLRNNCLTEKDKERLKAKQEASQTSKHKDPYVLHKHQNTKSDFLGAR